MLCVTALCAVFYTAFLVPSQDIEDRSWEALALLSLAAGISVASGMLFRECPGEEVRGLLRTLPVQIFFWAAGVMLAMFVASWYLEAHAVLYRDVRWF